MKKTGILIALCCAALFAPSYISSGIAQSECLGGPGPLPTNIGFVDTIIRIGRFRPPTASNPQVQTLSPNARIRDDGDANYDGGDIVNTAINGCLAQAISSNIPRIAGPLDSLGIINVSDLRFVLLADEPANGTSLLERLRLSFYENRCGDANLIPVLTFDLPINCSLHNGYYVFSLDAAQAAALQPFIAAAASSTSENAYSIYVGAGISVSRDDAFATSATAGEILYVGKEIQPACGPVTGAPLERFFDANGGQGILNITSDGCLWAAQSNAPWITITTGDYGSNNEAVIYTVSANDSGSTRTGTITVAGQSYTVTQSCNLISPTSSVFQPSGGNGTILITPQGAGCTGTPSTSVPWLHITNTGGGMINYSVDANDQPGSTNRIGIIDISGFDFVVTQAGMGGDCSIAPISFGESLNGILSTGDCPSTAGQNQVADRYSFTGVAGQQIGVSLAGLSGCRQLYLIDPFGVVKSLVPNTFTGTYESALPVSGTYTIEVASDTASPCTLGSYTLELCSFEYSATSLMFDHNGGTGIVFVTKQGNCACNAINNGSQWIDLHNPEDTLFCSEVDFSVLPNSFSTRSRTGILTIAGKTITVTQAADPCAYTLMPGGQHFTVAGGQGMVTFSAISNSCSWTATTNVNWITITSATGGTGPGAISYTVEPNSSSFIRTGTITIAGSPFSVTQGGCLFSVSPLQGAFTVNGGAGSINVSTEASCAWTASTSASFITITSGSTGPGNGMVDFMVAENTGPARAGAIDVAGQRITIYQSGVNTSTQYLDTMFGADGRVVTDVFGSTINAMALQPDGKIVALGAPFGSFFHLARYNSDGSRDASFGDHGFVSTYADVSVVDTADAVLVQPDGKIVVVVSGFGEGFVLARYANNGSPDPSFGTQGKTITNLGPALAWAAVIQPDGKIIVAGVRRESPTDDFILARYNSDGSLDSGFGSGGIIFTDMGGDDGANAVALQPDGKIIAAGYSSGNFALARYDSNGNPDSSFGTGGKVITDFAGGFDTAHAAVVQTDGKIVVAGETGQSPFINFDFALARYDSNGNLDQGFGIDGKITTDFSNGNNKAFAVALQPDEKIIAAGFASNPNGDSDFGLTRYNANGSPDSSFGASGWITADFLGGFDEARAVALQPDGKIVAAGSASFIAAGGASFSYSALIRTACSPSTTITAQPASLTVCERGSATLSVTATGTALSYQWRKNGDLIDGATNSSLTINPVETGDAGAYDVLVSGACGMIISEPATLTVDAYSINPSYRSFPANGGNGSISVTAGSKCNWAAVSNAVWITITGGAGGSGNGTVTYSVAANTGSTVRNGTVTIAGQTYTVYQGIPFADVPVSHPFYNEIGRLSARQVTLGCNATSYCPDDVVTRQQMAAFIIRALGDFSPPPPAMQRFADVPPSNPFYNFIEQMAIRQITLGCSANMYCPSDPVLRDQMAAFIIRALHPPGYIPPTPAMQRFPDVPPTNPFYAHIEEMAVRQITLGCGGGNYCPSLEVTRGQMAAFLVRAFNL
jgi:uncharacterized delta-60 repeat protein